MLGISSKRAYYINQYQEQKRDTFIEFTLSEKDLQATESWEWIMGLYIHILQKRKFSASLLACIQVYHVS